MTSVGNDNKSGYVLEIKTIQIAPFRTLMTALKDILLETNIIFDKTGIKIINIAPITPGKERGNVTLQKV